jgi:predicted alpha/beta-hydrolase family hydrolase
LGFSALKAGGPNGEVAQKPSRLNVQGRCCSIVTVAPTWLKRTAEGKLPARHRAGAGIESPFLENIAEHIAQHGIAVTRFEFDYMASRRAGGSKRPPPRAEALASEFRDLVQSAAWRRPQTLLIGGKSLGGRVASLIADELYEHGDIEGLVCLGYPFHPPGKPQRLRTQHLETLRCPALVVQGERDPFGNRAEVEGLTLSEKITFAWIGDGDHDFGPRGRSGFTRKGNLAAAADAVAAFAGRLLPAR